MKLADLKFNYPEHLIALEPIRPSRVMYVADIETPLEMTIDQLIEKIPCGDIFVINNTKVLKRRVFAMHKGEELEILFLDRFENDLDQNQNTLECNQWKVLFPSKKLSIGEIIRLPNGFQMKLIEKGRPQKVEVTPAIFENDFSIMAELPLPPYIQRARNQRHNVLQDETWYQTAWAEIAGSMAAPTASLHFAKEHLRKLKDKGVNVIELTLHVGLGTFLPVTTDDLDQHKMHSEKYEISEKNWNEILKAKKDNKNIWALGTTACRVLESVARTQVYFGETDILLQEGSQFKIVDRLLTNFHQPESTLLALVAGFAGLAFVKNCYQWAIDKEFKLFSYGDLTVWVKKS